MRLKELSLITIFFLFFSITVNAEVIKVGGYLFPPYLEKSNDTYHGLTIDLIDALNSFQDRFTFQLIETSPKRRYEHFDSGRFDILMFEDINWGWQNRKVSYTDIMLQDGEVYITTFHESKDQSYFDDLSGKSITIILGYHYAFANFISDEQYLEQNFQILFSRNHDINIRRVLNGIADISVVTVSYLKRYLMEHPQYAQSLLISEKYDQQYNQRILVSQNSAISVDEINQLLNDLNAKGILQRLWNSYGLP